EHKSNQKKKGQEAREKLRNIETETAEPDPKKLGPTHCVILQGQLPDNAEAATAEGFIEEALLFGINTPTITGVHRRTADTYEIGTMSLVDAHAAAQSFNDDSNQFSILRIGEADMRVQFALPRRLEHVPPERFLSGLLRRNDQHGLPENSFTFVSTTKVRLEERGDLTLVFVDVSPEGATWLRSRAMKMTLLSGDLLLKPVSRERHRSDNV
ncbi:MAG: hypothetical protein MK028_06980, partial [Dehalococcoidia bacterium]|nr:hypothetical protein [Dehalococcoidia bacterium]